MSSRSATPAIREIRNTWLCRVTGSAVRPEFCDLTLADGRIGQIRPNDYRRYLGAGDSRERSDGVIDAAARVTTPPLVNFHDHLYSRLAKGLSLPGSTRELRSILENLWWKLDEALDGPMIDACTRLGAAQSLQSGVSYLFDHHSSPNAVRGSLGEMGKVLTQAGLRAVLCLETSDRHGKEITEACFDEQQHFIRRSTSSELRGLIGLHAPFTLSDRTLRRAAALCGELETGIHIHLAEDAFEQRHSREAFDCTAGVRLDRFGLLARPGILAHGVHLAPEDWSVLTAAGCALALNPDSNLNNAVGLGRYTEFPESPPLVAGTDGMHGSPARTIKQLFLLHRHQGGELSESFAFIRRLYFDQISFVRRFFPDYPGLNPGDRADLVIWDYRPPSPFSAETFWGHLVYGILETPAWSVVMGAEPLLADCRLLSMDLDSLSRGAAEQGGRLFAKLGVTDHG